MNKYQEALFRIRLVLRTNHDEKWLYNELNLLHKLVDKATPMLRTRNCKRINVTGLHNDYDFSKEYN